MRLRELASLAALPKAAASSPKNAIHTITARMPECGDEDVADDQSGKGESVAFFAGPFDLAASDVPEDDPQRRDEEREDEGGVPRVCSSGRLPYGSGCPYGAGCQF